MGQENHGIALPSEATASNGDVARNRLLNEEI